jgi:hypothetical protein
MFTLTRTATPSFADHRIASPREIRAAARIRADVIFGRDSEIDDLKSSLEYGTSIEETAVFLCRSGSGRPQRERNERRDVRAPDLSYVDTSMHLHGCAKLPCSFW